MITTTRRLNAEQQYAHDRLVEFVAGELPDHHMMLLEGYAGTGKTTTITQTVRTLQNGDIAPADFFRDTLKIAVTAPTHKAVRVLKKMAKYDGQVDYATIHSLLGLKPQHDERTGKEKYVQSKDPDQIRIESFDVIMVDEASMLADELFDLLLKYTKSKKIIFIGDPVQIPPVNHPNSKPFIPSCQEKYKIGVVRLTQIMRQAEDNPILRYATRIRMDYLKAADFAVETEKSFQNGELRGIICMTRDEDVKNIIKEYFDCQEFRDNADYMKIIAYRNEIVNGFNNEVRKILYQRDYPDEIPYLVKGEKLIIDQSVISKMGKIILSTNEEVEVLGFEEKSTDVEWRRAVRDGHTSLLEWYHEPFKYYATKVSYFDDKGETKTTIIRILHESELKRYNKIVDSIRNDAISESRDSFIRNKLWVAYFNIQKEFAWVKYNYALTAHKSQGSTYENAMLVNWDINKNFNIEERNRIRYVGATRAKNQLFIVN